MAVAIWRDAVSDVRKLMVLEDEHRRLKTFQDYEQAPWTREEARVRYPNLVSRYDAVLCLSTTGEAPSCLQRTNDPSMNSAWTLLHVPCVKIPVLRGASGMPIGLQMVVPRSQDETALRVANWLQNFQQQKTVRQGC